MNDEATLALQMDRLMRRWHSDLHPRAQRIDTERIGPIGGLVLYVISENAPTTAQAICTVLGRDKSQVSRIIGLLVKKGLVETSSHGGDARQVRLSLSEKGALQLAAFNGAMVEATKSVLGPLDRREAVEFSALLAKILAAPS